MNKATKGIATLGIAIAIVFSSCHTNDKGSFVNEEKFNMKDIETLKLEGAVMRFNDMIMNPVGVNMTDTLLFLKNRSTEYIYHIYNLNNNEKVNECLTIGQGPDEFIFPLIVQSPDTNVWMFDRGKSILKKYNVSDLIGSHHPVSTKNISLKNQASDRVAVLSNGNILASINRLPRGGFDRYDSNGVFLDSIGKFPELTSRSLSGSEKIQSFRNGFTTNLKDRIFISYGHTDLIEIYDYEGNCLKRMHGPDQIKLVMDIQSAGGDYVAAKPVKGESYMCYSHSPVCAGNEVFVLYLGELMENYQDRYSKMIVFDWDGNPLRMYELDIPIFTFTVDTDHRIIYGITNSPEYMIIKYNY
jgi:hypothetical protein